MPLLNHPFRCYIVLPCVSNVCGRVALKVPDLNAFTDLFAKLAPLPEQNRFNAMLQETAALGGWCIAGRRN